MSSYKVRFNPFVSLLPIIVEALDGNSAENEYYRNVCDDHQSLCHISHILHEIGLRYSTYVYKNNGRDSENNLLASFEISLEDEGEAAFTI